MDLIKVAIICPKFLKLVLTSHAFEMILSHLFMLPATYILMPLNNLASFPTLGIMLGVSCGIGSGAMMDSGSTNNNLGLRASSNSLILLFNLIFSRSCSEME
jgi:hypothetical protein